MGKMSVFLTLLYVTIMVAIIIIAKELNVMVTSNPHIQGFSLSCTEQVQLRLSPFSSVPAPAWFLLPSLFHTGVITSCCVG